MRFWKMSTLLILSIFAWDADAQIPVARSLRGGVGTPNTLPLTSGQLSTSSLTAIQVQQGLALPQVGLFRPPFYRPLVGFGGGFYGSGYYAPYSYYDLGRYDPGRLPYFQPYYQFPLAAAEIANRYYRPTSQPQQITNFILAPQTSGTVQTPRTAVFTLYVPENAEVWLEDTKMEKPKGAKRVFQTPELTPGQSYEYKVVVRWYNDGKTLERTRRFNVQAGNQLSLRILE